MRVIEIENSDGSSRTYTGEHIEFHVDNKGNLNISSAEQDDCLVDVYFKERYWEAYSIIDPISKNV